MPYNNLHKRREAIRAWKLKNKEKLKQQARDYHKRKYVPHPRQLMTPEELKASKSEQDRKYRLNNAEVIKKNKAKYYQKNKKRILKKYLLILKQDINKRLAHNLRNRLKSAIKRGRKAGSAFHDLGCSIEEFKSYIASKFKDGMSWNNYGKWHLDHIIPLCKFDFSNRKDFLKAAHYTNYQPLWAEENLKKNKYE
jgi:hypothetical protein